MMKVSHSETFQITVHFYWQLFEGPSYIWLICESYRESNRLLFKPSMQLNNIQNALVKIFAFCPVRFWPVLRSTSWEALM